MQLNTNNSMKNTQIITDQSLQFKGGIAALVLTFTDTICITWLKPDRFLNPVEAIASVAGEEAIVNITML